jgi:ATP-dependent DNA ligase
MKRCSWVEPILVAQVKFTEWTSDGQLRQPVFLGLRANKQAKAAELWKRKKMPFQKLDGSVKSWLRKGESVPR